MLALSRKVTRHEQTIAPKNKHPNAQSILILAICESNMNENKSSLSFVLIYLSFIYAIFTSNYIHANSNQIQEPQAYEIDTVCNFYFARKSDLMNLLKYEHGDVNRVAINGNKFLFYYKRTRNWGIAEIIENNYISVNVGFIKISETILIHEFIRIQQRFDFLVTIKNGIIRLKCDNNTLDVMINEEKFFGYYLYTKGYTD